ncbi:MAG: hypothetical protein H5U16_11415 [Roseovarius sp.]|nr:hypothetical protein [Roseovarius sp.]
MSTWTSEVRAALGALAALLLAGCLAPAEQAPRPAIRQVAMGGGAVIVTAPRGYCVEPDSLRRSAGRVALLASCERLTGTPGIAVAPALMTVSVMPQGDAPAPSPEGLARAVAPAPAQAGGRDAGLAYVQVMRGGDTVLPGGDPRHWRGAMAVAGQLVGLALYAPAGSALSGREGRDLLRDLGVGVHAR